MCNVSSGQKETTDAAAYYTDGEIKKELLLCI